MRAIQAIYGELGSRVWGSIEKEKTEKEMSSEDSNPALRSTFWFKTQNRTTDP